MNKDVMFSSKTDQWETPKDFFDDLDALFHFTLDACALPENAKCEKYFTPEMDGLKQEWGGVVWCNPMNRFATVRFVKGRLKFGGSRNGAPFPSMVVIFRK